jgi:molybdopterin-biosynthesis enzyme MoeA-like protein
MGTPIHVVALIIGDELLSGKRQDQHLAFLIGALQARGLSLHSAHLLGDDREQLVATFRHWLAQPAVVFSFGGIGATPDDHTRQALAAAAAVPLQAHSEAVALIETRFGASAYPNRILMANLPAGATLIPNPVNQVPGFAVQSVYCVPGFPAMAWPMVEWVLDQYYADHFGPPVCEARLWVPGAKESDLLPHMETLVQQHPCIRFSSLPSFDHGGYIEFGLRGMAAAVAQADADWRATLTRLGYRWQETPLG